MKFKLGEYEIESTEIRDDFGFLKEHVEVIRTLEDGSRVRYPIAGLIKIRTAKNQDFTDQRYFYNEEDLNFMLVEFLQSRGAKEKKKTDAHDQEMAHLSNLVNGF